MFRPTFFFSTQGTFFPPFFPYNNMFFYSYLHFPALYVKSLIYVSPAMNMPFSTYSADPATPAIPSLFT